MSSEYQAEIRDRMRCDHILVPQVFVDGQHVGVSFARSTLNHESSPLFRGKLEKPQTCMRENEKGWAEIV